MAARFAPLYETWHTLGPIEKVRAAGPGDQRLQPAVRRAGRLPDDRPHVE